MANAGLILLVDDYEDALDIYREYLMYRGYRVIVARNGREAIDMAQQHRPDLILLDLRMPGMSGLDVIRVLRRDPVFQRCPIVALTAHALDMERVQALRAGFDEVIAKPCLPDELAEAVGRILGNKAAGPLVLLGTDFDDHARTYAAALMEAGFGVQLVRAGSEVLTIARRVRPACVVLDLRLPDMNAWDVCKRLKTQAENVDTRIIVLTPHLTEEAAAGSVTVGCHAWLMQPTVAGDLVEAVREVLDSDRPAPASAGDALLGVVTCPACSSQNVRAGVRVAAFQYYCCQACRLCWRVEPASAST